MKAPSLFPLNPVLIVDDEPESLRSFGMTLRMHGITRLVTCEDSRKVASLLSQGPFDLMLLDLTMPFVSGEEILSMAAEQHPHIPIIVVTAMDEVDTAVRCMQKGAFDYMVKPVERSRLVSGVRRAIEIKELRDQTRSLKERMLSGMLENPEAFSGIITKDKAMFAIFQYLESIAPSRQPVLVTGETGVGKELMVKAIHILNGEKTALVSVNVAGLDDNVFSDTLFGHVKGAFTGASERRKGLVEKAAGGILHLDEIGDLSDASQIKLLRLLQEGEYFPLGSDTARMTNARVVATTNRDLSTVQESGRFRKDLYYRLSVHHVDIPPLRRRKEDIPLLLDHFMNEAARSLGIDTLSCSEEASALLARYDFPGNVRELKMMIFDAVSRNKSGRLSMKDFAGRISNPAIHIQTAPLRTSADASWATRGREERLPTIEEATLHLIREALARCNNNQSKAAQLLGISRQRLARQLNKRTT